MIQAKLLEMVLKAILKHPKMRELFKYKDEPNDCDIKVSDLEKKVTDVGFKVTAAVDMIKKYAETIDNVADKVKSIDKITHPPAIPLKDIDELKESAKDVKWMMGLFKIMKKNPLLKSMFK